MNTKHHNNSRIRRMVEHRNNPTAPVDASTLLSKEAERLRFMNTPLSRKMAWGMAMASARLEAWGDPTSLVQYRKV